MKKIRLLLVGLLCLWQARSQTLKVSDQSGIPIAGVTLKGKNATIQTNINGMVNIAPFAGEDSVSIICVGYVGMVMNYKQLLLQTRLELTEKSFSLDEVVVSSSRFEEKRRDVPQQIQVLKAKDIAFMNQQNLGDVLQNSGNVYVQKSQQGGGSPILRGFEANKVLMVIDGVRMNNAIYRGGHLQNIITVDNTVLDKVEVVFGAGSVVYGSDALGGVMHFYTKNPILSGTEKLLVKANAFVRTSTANEEKTAHVNLNLGWNRLASFTAVTVSDFGDLMQGANRNPFYGNWGSREFYAERINGTDSMMLNSNSNLQKQSGYRQMDVLQKLLFKQNNKMSHVLNIQFSTSGDVPRYDRLTTLSGSGKPSNTEWYYGPQNRLMTAYSLILSGFNMMYDQARITLAWQSIEESRHDRRFGNTNRNHRVENVEVLTWNADFSKKAGKSEWRYGLDAAYNAVQSKGTRENIVTGVNSALDSRYPDGGSNMQSVAAYITHSYEYSNRLIFNEGLRLSNVSLYSRFNDTTFFPFPFKDVTQSNMALNGSLGLVYMPGREWRLTALLNSGFRAPNVDDLSKVFESVPGNVVVPNPGLKPEYTYTAELGMSKTIEKSTTIGATAFYTIYKDAITTKTGRFKGSDSVLYNGVLSRVTMNVNALEAYIYGWQAFLTSDITGRLSVNTTLNFTYGRIKTDSSEYPLDHIPPMYGRTGLTLKLNKLRTEFYMMYSAWKELKDYNMFGEDNFAYATPNGMPSWYTLNLRTAWYFHKNLSAQLALENILDQNYRQFGSNISAAGRNLVLTLRGSF